MTNQKKILILAYYRFSDPVFRSAVLPYFLEFPNVKDFRFYLVTFEDRDFVKSAFFKNQKSNLSKQNIELIPISRFKWGIPFVNRSYEFLVAFFKAVFLIKTEKIKGVYSEGFPSAILGYSISKLIGIKHLIHTFEPHADYMLEGGTWSNYSWKYQVMKRSEIMIAKNAYKLFTGTNEYISILESKGVRKDSVTRVPSCIDTELFCFRQEDRIKIREKLGVNERQKLICYLGKFGGMYFKEETFELFSTFAKSASNEFRFLIITPEITDEIKEFVELYELQNLLKYCSLSEQREVSAYLSASDIGLVAVRQKPSKKYCSPIKTGEYLACGLPVIIPRNISDDYEILNEEGIGIIMDGTSQMNYENVVESTIQLFKTYETHIIRQKARGYCVKDRSISQYKFLYERIFQSL